MIVCLIACSALGVGCQSTSPASAGAPAAAANAQLASFEFFPEDYPQVHEAAVAVLREHGFRIARNDYRFGTVTTYVKESPTVLEFWIDDASTSAQRRADTLNAQQRMVKLTILSLPGFDLSDPLSDQDEDDIIPPYYKLTVQVLVERLQLPDRYLTHSVRGQIAAEYTTTPTHLSDRGITGPYAQPMTRDPHLEARIVNAIALKARELGKIRALQRAD